MVAKQDNDFLLDPFKDEDKEKINKRFKDFRGASKYVNFAVLHKNLSSVSTKEGQKKKTGNFLDLDKLASLLGRLS